MPVIEPLVAVRKADRHCHRLVVVKQAAAAGAPPRAEPVPARHARAARRPDSRACATGSTSLRTVRGGDNPAGLASSVLVQSRRACQQRQQAQAAAPDVLQHLSILAAI